jgi:hypothetical protein
MGLFDALKQIADTAGALPAAGNSADVEVQRYARYHKRIVFVGGCFAALGAVLGLITSVLMASEVKSGRDIRGVILAPLLYGAGGFVFGMAIMCLFAPRAFLTGPVGAPWMKLIGTRNVLVARITCLLLGLVVTLPLVGLGLLLALSK